MNGFTPSFEMDVNREFAGISDVTALQREVESLRSNLAAAQMQMSVERSCAIRFSVEVSNFLKGNPLLEDILSKNDRANDPNGKPTLLDVMNVVLGEGDRRAYEPDETTQAAVARKLRRELRTELHPDRGGSTELAQAAGELIDQFALDPKWAIANAALLSNSVHNPSLQDLRDERYELTFALAAAGTKFATKHEAEIKLQEKVANLPWQVRVEAALVCLGRICGTPEQLAAFIRRVSENPRDHANQIQPIVEELPVADALVRRIMEGVPKQLTDDEVKKIDGILEKVWAVHADQTFEPPFLAWLEIIRPVFEILDPSKPDHRLSLYAQTTRDTQLGDTQDRPQRFFGSRRNKRDEQDPIDEKISYIFYTFDKDESNNYEKW